jgi:hypothetical protein
MLKSELLAAIQREIQSHNFPSYADDPLSIAQGGIGTCRARIPKRGIRIKTMSEFLDAHQTNSTADFTIGSGCLSRRFWALERRPLGEP